MTSRIPNFKSELEGTELSQSGAEGKVPIAFNAPALVNLQTYDQSGFDRGRPSWVILLWWLVQAIAFPSTPHFANSLRVSLLRWFGATIGQNVIIRPTARITYPWKLSIGSHSWIGDDVVLYSLDCIQIGDHCVISQKSYLCTGSHEVQDPAFGLKTAPITVANGVWVASDCFIAPGVAIGANAVIGARSTVLKDMPNQRVCWGNPCQPRYLRTIRPT
jgi:putative colanic acid biosynthesis acetyltransferase WcaF